MANQELTFEEWEKEWKSYYGWENEEIPDNLGSRRKWYEEGKTPHEYHLWEMSIIDDWSRKYWKDKNKDKYEKVRLLTDKTNAKHRKPSN